MIDAYVLLREMSEYVFEKYIRVGNMRKEWQKWGMLNMYNAVICFKVMILEVIRQIALLLLCLLEGFIMLLPKDFLWGL